MLQLFNEYKNAGKLSEALLVGRNAFNRNPGNIEIFNAYYSYLCDLAERLPLLAERARYADQASVALAFFSENAELNDTVLGHISEYQVRLDNIYQEIDKLQLEKEDLTMLQLFNECKNAGKFSEALLVGRNAFNRNPDNIEIFLAYFSYLSNFAETSPTLLEKTKLADQANAALAFFSENAELNALVLKHISECQERLDTIYKQIAKSQRDKEKKQQKEITDLNSKALKELYAFEDKLRVATSQEEFDKILAEIGAVDAEIVKDAFSKEQSDFYNSLTKDHTDLISAKMRELEYKRNVAYNKKAADTFEKAFNNFKKDEDKYKNQTQLFILVSSTLFAFDASRLFNETLIYYNHVYSYIFSKLDDDGKLALTRYSIECERKLS